MASFSTRRINTVVGNASLFNLELARPLPSGAAKRIIFTIVREEAMPKSTRKENKTSNGANLGFEATLWLAADKLRNNMDAA
jgi:hypothetical protein